MGFKIVLEIFQDGPRTTFDPQLIIGRNVEDMHLLEQTQLPFHLKVKADKDVYDVKESITFTITLENSGSQPFQVMDLDEHSLFCRIDDVEWGSQTPENTTEKVLQPMSSLSKVLRVAGIAQPKTTSISCRYSVGSKGVQPFDSVKIRIKPLS